MKKARILGRQGRSSGNSSGLSEALGASMSPANLKISKTITTLRSTSRTETRTFTRSVRVNMEHGFLLPPDTSIPEGRCREQGSPTLRSCHFGRERDAGAVAGALRALFFGLRFVTFSQDIIT
jgi:hypothetical protein